MVRWARIFGDQYLGFWILGIVLFALQEVPYMVMPSLNLENNPIMNMLESSVILDVFEKISGSACIVIMTFIVREHAPLFSVGSGIHKAGFLFAAAVLLLNFIGWGLYFSGHQSPGTMMFFIVALPPLYYAGIGLWRGNWPLLIAGIIFEAVHVIHVYGNLRM